MRHSMNEIERAISILELMAIDLTGTLGGLSETNPLCDVVKQRIESNRRSTGCSPRKVGTRKSENQRRPHTEHER